MTDTTCKPIVSQMVGHTREKTQGLKEMRVGGGIFIRRSGVPADTVKREQHPERKEEGSPAGICGKGTRAEGTASAKPPGRMMLAIFQEQPR